MNFFSFELGEEGHQILEEDLTLNITNNKGKSLGIEIHLKHFH